MRLRSEPTESQFHASIKGLVRSVSSPVRAKGRESRIKKDAVVRSPGQMRLRRAGVSTCDQEACGDQQASN